MGGPRTGNDLDARRVMSPEWSDDELAILREHWPNEAMTSRMIARLLPGRSHNSVGKRAHRLGLPPRPNPMGVPRAEPKPVRARALRPGEATLPPLGSLS